MRYPCALKLALPAFAAGLLLASLSRAADHTITVGPGLAFQPSTLTIAVGDTVFWSNTTGAFHNVRANDGSFSNGGGGANFLFSRTFNAAGTVGYHCSFHGSPGAGMFGTVIVQGSGGGGEAGTLRFSLAVYTVNEGAGSATINVQRVGGADGAVSVSYSAAAGTAAAGQDFTAVSATLSWPDNDDDTRSFTVPILDDGTAEGGETILLALSAPTGGAVLDGALKTATLSILDNDTAPGGTPAAPGNLQAAAQSTTEIELTWNDNSSNEVGFRIEGRTVSGVTYQEILTAGANATQAVIPGLDPSTFYLFRVRATGGATNSGFSNEAGAATLGNIVSCVAGPETLCLNNGRFKAELEWRTAADAGAGQVVPLPSAPDSGLFYFFSPTNIELLIKVLNACVPPFNRYWTFFSATTNVEFAVVVTDTQSGKTRSYFNPLGRSAPPVQDVDAFATCP